MSVIDKYIFKLCNAAIITVIGCLLTLTSLFALFEELNESDIAYGFWDAANYILATTPNRVQELLIYSVFLGLLISLGRLAESNELTILRTSGWSPLKILVALMPTILIWVIISTLISEFLIPNSEKEAEVQKLQFVETEGLSRKTSGLWFKDKNLFMRISAFGINKDIVGITQYRIDDKQRLAEVIYARSGTYQIEHQNWMLTDVKITTFGINQVTTSASSSRIWSNSISPDMLASQAFIEPKKMSLMELTLQINYLDDQNIAKSQYSIAFWSRLLEPLAYIGLALYSIAILLGPMRETSAGSRIAVGVFSGLGFMYLKNLFSPMVGVFGLPAILAILIPIAIVYLIALRLIQRNA